MTVYEDYLKRKIKEGVRVKVFLKSKTTGKNGNLNSIMLSGVVKNIDEDAIELADKECLIMRTELISVSLEQE